MLVLATLFDACIGIPRKRPPLPQEDLHTGETGATGMRGATSSTGASGASCTDEQGCDPLEACVDGECRTSGCGASNLCRGGCCNGGECVALASCSNDKTCSGGVCPARCDDASGGAGCRSGCCVTATGECEGGTTDGECGDGGDCRTCGAGSVCNAGTCVCASCNAGEVCVTNGCADCATSPCIGTAPVCDGTTTHACQPCTAQPSFCSGATTYCNNDGACSAIPTSDAACAREDSQKPKLVAPGVCGCDATTPCNDGLSCDLATHSCFTSCTIDTSTRCAGTATYCDDGTRCVAAFTAGATCTDPGQCASLICACADATCSTRKCSSVVCGACEFTSDGLACGGDIAQNTPNGSCTGTTHCDGSGNCDPVRGQPCSTDSDCSTGICEFSQNDLSARVCSDVVCAECKFTADAGVSCAGNVQQNRDHTTCSGAAKACDGAGTCKKDAAQSCSADGDCASGNCEWIGAFGISKGCSLAACGPCQFNANGDGSCEGIRTKNLNCTTSSACTSGQSTCCDTTGTCRDPGDCTNNCSGSAPACSAGSLTFNSCNVGATATAACGFTCGACNTLCSECVCKF